ncbi:MAG: hypothetical protein EOP50_10825, partial [Sphingobacteriales bacterium]
TGTAAGKGIMDPKARGMAPDARVLGHLFEVAWLQTKTMSEDYNMNLTNNSYASVVNDCSFAGIYDPYANMLDELSLSHPQVQHVFAAGNDGLLTCNGFAPGYATVAGGYQPAKNIITVGGVEKNYALAGKSARGPVRDGRLKPEIVTNGWQMYSCTADDQYVTINGTSMAAPGVTGGLALLTEQYRLSHAGETPRGDLLKAILLNGAVDLGNPGPDFLFGFGMMNVFRSAAMLKAGNFIADSVANNDSKTHALTLPAGLSKLKLMLYWHDAPGSPTAATALIDNLDLELTTPTGTLHRPLVLDPSTSGADDVATEGTDNLNNVEQIVINNPPAGAYSILVKGSAVPSGSRRYVIAYDLVEEGLELKFPSPLTPIASGDSIQIYWDASEGTDPFTIEFSDNNGGSWITIASNVPADRRHQFWYVPAVTTHQAMVRVSRNGQQSASGAFLIGPQPRPVLDANQCPGYIAISWPPDPGVTSWEVMRKAGDDMRVVAATNINSYVFSGLSPDSTYYVAVRPLINGGAGFRSKAIRRKPSDGNCLGAISDGDLR